MYSGEILSAGELIDRYYVFQPKREHDALGILKEIYRERGKLRSEEALKVDSECLKAINDICDRTLTGRFVLPLPAGAGKTTLIVAWCAYIHRSKSDFSVAIASLKVEASFQLRQQLLNLGIPEEDIGILYSDKDKKMAEFKAICPSTDEPWNCRFLLVTHARLEERSYRKSHLSFNGKDRSIIFYDEEFRARKGFSFDTLRIKHDLSGFIDVADYHNIKGLSAGDMQSIKQLSSSILNAIDTHLDCKAESKSLGRLSERLTDEQKHSVLKAIKANKKKLGLTGDTVEFIEHIINDSSMFLRELKVYGYIDNIPDEIQQLLILDASYKFSKLSQLDDEINELPIGITKTYKNLTVTYIECPSGRHSITRLLSSPTERADLMGRVAEYIQGIPCNEAVLIFTYIDKGDDEFESVIRRELTKLGINMDERVKTKDGKDKPKYVFLTWGQQNGTNDYMYCRHMCTVGVLDLGADNIIAQAVAQTQGEYLFDDEALDPHELSISDIAQRIYQAMCRIAIRNHEDCEPCTVALFLNKIAMESAGILKGALPQARFLRARPVFKTSMTTTDIVLELALEVIDGFPYEEDSISTKEMFKLVENKYGGAITKTVKGLVMGKLKRMIDQGCLLWEHKGRTLSRVRLFP